MLEPIIIISGMVTWIVGFQVFRIRAAREAGRASGQGTIRNLVWTGWLKGPTPEARRYRNLAFAWLIGWLVILITTIIFLQHYEVG